MLKNLSRGEGFDPGLVVSEMCIKNHRLQGLQDPVQLLFRIEESHRFVRQTDSNTIVYVSKSKFNLVIVIRLGVSKPLQFQATLRKIGELVFTRFSENQLFL